MEQSDKCLTYKAKKYLFSLTLGWRVKEKCNEAVLCVFPFSSTRGVVIDTPISLQLKEEANRNSILAAKTFVERDALQFKDYARIFPICCVMEQ